MKKTILIAACALSLLVGYKSEAWVSVNLQFGAPVMNTSWWGADNDYYYMPQQGVYYNVRRHMYVYPNAGNWCYGPSLPASYGAYNFAPGTYYRVRARAPFQNHGYYQRMYGYRQMQQPRYDERSDRGRYDNGNHNGWNRNDGRNDRDNRYADGRGYGGNNGRDYDNNRGNDGRGRDGRR